MRSKHAFALIVLLLSGCAFIKNGTTQKVTFETMPPKAEVWLNGQKYPDLTPTTIELPRGEVAYEIRKTGFDNRPGVIKTRTSSYFYWSLLMGFLAGGLDMITGAWLDFDIPDEDKDTVKIALDPSIDNSEHVIALSSNPPGASINIDKLDLQEKTGVLGRGTRVNVKWKGPSDQERQIVLKHLGFEDAHLKLRRGQKSLHKDLEPVPTTQTVKFESDPPGAEVLVDGRIVTRTPASEKFKWFIGDDRQRPVEFRMAGYYTKASVIKDKFDTTISVKLLEKIETVPVKIECSPAGSDLEIEGTGVGQVPAEIKLDWSVKRKSYKFKVSRPGYFTHEGVIEEGKRSDPITIRLKPSLPDFP